MVVLRWTRLRDPILGYLTPEPGTTFYVVGHSGSIRRIRVKLLELGWARRQIRARAYWADGRRGR